VQGRPETARRSAEEDSDGLFSALA
jgi:hypothetical protein